MIVKTLEVRDDGTFLPVLAIKCSPANEAERYLLARSGYGNRPTEQSEYVLMSPLGGKGTLNYDHLSWGNRRTLVIAHDYIRTHFDELESGAVVDVEFLLHETDTPKISEAVR